MARNSRSADVACKRVGGFRGVRGAIAEHLDLREALEVGLATKSDEDATDVPPATSVDDRHNKQYEGLDTEEMLESEVL